MRARVRELYRDVVGGAVRAKQLAYYREEWERAYRAVLEARARAGKRTPPRPPPVHILLRFILPDGTERGAKSAPAVADLRRGELRIPSYGIKVRLPPSTVRSLLEENNLEPRPEFVLQVTSSGRVRVVAQRFVRAPVRLPARVIAVDENSLNGFALGVWDVLARGDAVLVLYEKLKPPNHGHRRRAEALLKSFADKPEPEKRAALAELLPRELVSALTPERAKELAAETRAKERRLNNAFVESLVHELRRLVREARERGYAVVVVVDPIRAESVKHTPLQGTLLRARRALRNLAGYEGALYVEARVSGKRCPLCGREGVETGRRRYRCARCGLEWDRDKCAVFQLAQKALACHLREECSDYSIVDLAGWLREHPRALL